VWELMPRGQRACSKSSKPADVRTAASSTPAPEVLLIDGTRLYPYCTRTHCSYAYSPSLPTGDCKVASPPAVGKESRKRKAAKLNVQTSGEVTMGALTLPMTPGALTVTGAINRLCH
jgi:hypothetical protein